jgi:hypothetical protein
VHEAKDGVKLVVIQVDALALDVADLQPFAGFVLADAEGHARIDATQHTDEAVPDAVAFGDVFGNVLFAIVGGVEVDNLTPEFARARGLERPPPGER